MWLRACVSDNFLCLLPFDYLHFLSVAESFRELSAFVLDINECSSENGGCVSPATCHNDVGSFHCECGDGYRLSTNGLACEST